MRATGILPVSPFAATERGGYSCRSEGIVSAYSLVRGRAGRNV